MLITSFCQLLMCIFWKHEENGEIWDRGSKERCKLYGISSSFNPLYLVLIPMVRGRGPETEETICERQIDIMRGEPQWKGFGCASDEAWCSQERGHWSHFCSSLALPRAGSCGNCKRSCHDSGVVIRGRKGLLQQTWRQQESRAEGVEQVNTWDYSNQQMGIWVGVRHDFEYLRNDYGNHVEMANFHQ